MKLIYIDTLFVGKIRIPFRITIGDTTTDALNTFLIPPEVHISKRVFKFHNISQLQLNSAPPFCDLADELIEIFQDQHLVFSERHQFLLLKAQFKTIGYNFYVNPKIVWHAPKTGSDHTIEHHISITYKINSNNDQFSHLMIACMRASFHQKPDDELIDQPRGHKNHTMDWSNYQSAPGVYFFLDELDQILYVGKAKNIKKRLQSHFSSSVEPNNIDYSKVSSITVDYTGNDIIAQLVESAQIKTIKPIYNSQQITDAAPFIINRGETANGIHRLKITRKDIQDNMPERYFNRISVKQSLQEFCTTNHLCRKHCGLETVKGPCSNVTVLKQACVCAGTESIAVYNNRFDAAFFEFQQKKSRKIYKLKGRSLDEDAFIYTVNDIFEGYGFIDKTEFVVTENDILGHLILMTNNYDTSRIINGLPLSVSKENVFILE